MKLAASLGFGLPLVLALGCSAAPEGEEPSDTQESEITTPCTWGTTCPAALLVTQTREFGAGRPPARLRSDIVVSTTQWEPTPRVFRQHTTRPLRFDGQHGVTLTGPELGSSFGVDNALVIEVLGQDGSLLDAAYVGVLDPATIAGRPLRRIGGEHSGYDYGFRFAPVDISSLLPKETAFRLRFSAIDNGGSAAVSDVWLRRSDVATPPPPPPPPNEDVFASTWCEGSPISKSQFVSHFTPGAASASFGTLTFEARKRNCHDLTGCGVWEVAESVSLRKWPDANGLPRPDFAPAPVSGPLVGSVSSEAASLSFADAASQLTWRSQARLEWYDHALYFGDRSAITFEDRGADVGTTNLHRNGFVKVNEHCLQVVRSGRDYHSSSGLYTEYEVVFHARY